LEGEPKGTRGGFGLEATVGREEKGERGKGGGKPSNRQELEGGV